MQIEANTTEKTILETLQTVNWVYLPENELQRSYSDVILRNEFDAALARLNGIAGQDAGFRSTAYQHLKKVIDTGPGMGLVNANQRFFELIRDGDSIQFGSKGEHVPVCYIDFKHPERNSYIVSSRVVYPMEKRKGGREFDVVHYINGIPVIVGEAKSPVSNHDWSNGAKDINNTYLKDCENFFVPSAFVYASDGKRYRYATVGTPVEKWGPWRTDGHKEEGNLSELRITVASMLKPEVILDIIYNFTLYLKKKGKPTRKIICRYQQYEGANKIIERVKEGNIKKGLIWHFQGSGKSFLMIFAAQKLRLSEELSNPTVIIVIDRRDLDNQITGTFKLTDIPNTKHENKVWQLKADLKAGIRKILITTIQKFREVTEPLDDRSNIIVFADEAHRTQYGDFGNYMHVAIPNGFYFGFTGTPLNESRRNTFDKFGTIQDDGGYMAKYPYEEAVADGEILELHFEAAPFEIRIDHNELSRAFEELMGDESDDHKAYVAKRASNIANVMAAPENVKLICDHIMEHFKANVEPNGLKAMVVAADRACCHEYKKYFDQFLPKEMTEVVISAAPKSSKSEKPEFKQYYRDSYQEAKLLERFDDPKDPFKIVIVTSKLLTGFDAPILQTMYLAKLMKGHNLLQAVCRTNRTYTNIKTFGGIVDYLGIFTKFQKALAFDGVDMKSVISNFDTLRIKFPGQMQMCLDYFPGVDMSVINDDSLEAARSCLPDKAFKESFADDFVEMHKLWEAISPHPMLGQYIKQYVFLCKLYEYIMPTNDYNMIWQAFGEKTIQLIRGNVYVDFTDKPVEELVFDANFVVKAMRSKSILANVHSLRKSISKRIREHGGDSFFSSLGEHLDELRKRHDDNEITSVEFLKEMIDLAKKLVEEEKRRQEVDPRDEAKKKLTQLFEQYAPGKTKEELGSLVTDIDEVVMSEECMGWKETISKEHLFKKKIASIIVLDHDINDYELVDKAIDYVKEYYRDVKTP